MSEHTPFTFVEALALDDDELERLAIDAIDAALGPLVREEFEPGSVLLREGEAADTLYVVFSGRVELSLSTDHGRLLLHAASTGRIIGLHTLAGSPTVFLTCTAADRVTAARLPVDRLSEALRGDPLLRDYFVALVLRAHATRHRRSVELQVEVEELNRTIAAERDQLSDALERLESAQAQLVESARMATLGELAAGLAHELNNPVGAIERAARFVAEDVEALVAELPGSSLARPALEAALRGGVVTTAEHRRRRRDLAEALGDRRLADKMLAAGISDIDMARDIVRQLSDAGDDSSLDQLTRHHQLGTALRDLLSASGRISDLVASLRSYARPSEGPPLDVDVHETIEDALRLLGHRLAKIDVVRRYGRLPEISARPGELTQVWTNVIANAIDAMDDEGVLVVKTEALPRRLQIRVVDNGPGIAPEALEKLFREQFTTKSGRIAYGLGMGLVISKRIVEAHGGTIKAVSSPGGTTVIVELPTPTPTPRGRP